MMQRQRTKLTISFMCFVDHQDDRWKTARPAVSASGSSDTAGGKQLPTPPSQAASKTPEPDYEPVS